MKYIGLECTTGGVKRTEYIAIDRLSGLVDYTGATEIRLWEDQMTKYVDVEGTGFTQALADNLRDAIIKQAAKPWWNATEMVDIPAGEVVVTIKVG